jgi:hypothetical protein
MTTESLEGRFAYRTYTFERLAVSGASLLSLGAAAIHFGVLGSHYEESWGYGAFFAAVASLQAVWALLVVRPPGRWVYWAGAAGNAAVISAWAVTRTAGVPLGPSSGEVEDMGFIDVLATGFQALIVVSCLAIIGWRQMAARQLSASVLWTGTLAVAVGVMALTGASLVDWASGGADAHGEAAAAADTHSEHDESAVAVGTEGDWGIKVISVALTADGGMIDVRYQVTDPAKAAAALGGAAGHDGHGAITAEALQDAPLLVDEKTGYAVMEANLHQMGGVRRERQSPDVGKTYFILFANTGGLVEPGDEVSLAASDLRLEHLEVE